MSCAKSGNCNVAVMSDMPVPVADQMPLVSHADSWYVTLLETVLVESIMLRHRSLQSTPACSLARV
jgi:hypothetical protein